jgi:hypothetical protein
MKKLIILCLFITFSSIISCRDNSQKQEIKENNNKLLEKANDEIIKQNDNPLENYIFNEILNGIKYTEDFKNKNGVIKIYGEPIEDTIRINSETFFFRGGKVKGVREIKYEDLLHRYYIYEDDTQFYVHVLANKPMDRLKSINIGDFSEKIIITFGKNYYQDGGEDIIYDLENDSSVIFFIRDKIIHGVLYVINDF